MQAQCSWQISCLFSLGKNTTAFFQHMQIIFQRLRFYQLLLIKSKGLLKPWMFIPKHHTSLRSNQWHTCLYIVRLRMLKLHSTYSICWKPVYLKCYQLKWTDSQGGRQDLKLRVRGRLKWCSICQTIGRLLLMMVKKVRIQSTLEHHSRNCWKVREVALQKQLLMSQAIYSCVYCSLRLSSQILMLAFTEDRIMNQRTSNPRVYSQLKSKKSKMNFIFSQKEESQCRIAPLKISIAFTTSFFSGSKMLNYSKLQLKICEKMLTSRVQESLIDLKVAQHYLSFEQVRFTICKWEFTSQFFSCCKKLPIYKNQGSQSLTVTLARGTSFKDFCLKESKAPRHQRLILLRNLISSWFLSLYFLSYQIFNQVYECQCVKIRFFSYLAIFISFLTWVCRTWLPPVFLEFSYRYFTLEQLLSDFELPLREPETEKLLNISNFYIFYMQKDLQDIEAMKAQDPDLATSLDESITDSIFRDLKMVAVKFKCVLVPRCSNGELAAQLRNWDLWGPILICLVLGLALSLATNDSQDNFGILFITMFMGAAIITFNCKILGSKIKFFQTVSFLGYCVCPMVLMVFILVLLKVAQVQTLLLNVLLVGVACVWSILAATGFLSTMIAQQKRTIAMYPVVLFYMLLSSYMIYV